MPVLSIEGTVQMSRTVHAFRVDQALINLRESKGVAALFRV